MTKGRSRKRYQTPRKSSYENDHSQSGQGEEIATPPAQCTSHRRGTEMNSSDPLQTEESGIGNEIYYAAPAVSPNANHQVQRVPLFTDDRTAEPVPNAAQTLEDQQFEDPESQQRFIQWYGARMGGPKYYAINPISRLFLYHILHTMSL